MYDFTNLSHGVNVYCCLDILWPRFLAVFRELASLSTYKGYGVTYWEEMDFVHACLNIIKIGILKSLKSFYGQIGTVMRRLTTGIRSENSAFRRFRRCANVVKCTTQALCNLSVLFHIGLQPHRRILATCKATRDISRNTKWFSCRGSKCFVTDDVPWCRVGRSVLSWTRGNAEYKPLALRYLVT